jgi:hypothetical protein
MKETSNKYHKTTKHGSDGSVQEQSREMMDETDL